MMNACLLFAGVSTALGQILYTDVINLNICQTPLVMYDVSDYVVATVAY